MKKLKYYGTGIYSVYSDIYLDVIKRGEDEHIEIKIFDRNNNIHLPNLLAVKRLKDKLDTIINRNKDYFNHVGE